MKKFRRLMIVKMALPIVDLLMKATDWLVKMLQEDEKQ